MGGWVGAPARPENPIFARLFAFLELGLFRNHRPVTAKTKTVYTKTRFLELVPLHGWVGWCVGPDRKPNLRLDCWRFWNWRYSAIAARWL